MARVGRIVLICLTLSGCGGQAFFPSDSTPTNLPLDQVDSGACQGHGHNVSAQLTNAAAVQVQCSDGSSKLVLP